MIHDELAGIQRKIHFAFGQWENSLSCLLEVREVERGMSFSFLCLIQCLTKVIFVHISVNLEREKLGGEVKLIIFFFPTLVKNSKERQV